MRKRILIIPALWFLVWALPIPELKSEPGPEIKRMSAGVVRIRAGIDEGEDELSWQTGTGLIARVDREEHYILTVTHVVKGADKIEIEYRSRRNRFTAARVVRMQGGDPNGVALLIVQGRPPPGARTLFVAKAPGLNEVALAIGFPRRGKPWQVTRGKVDSVQPDSLSFSARVDSGNSGGPLLNAGGAVLGLVTSTRGGKGFALPAGRLATILEGWSFELPLRPADPKTGIAFPRHLAKFFPGLLLKGLAKTKSEYLAFGDHPTTKKDTWKSGFYRLDANLEILEKRKLSPDPGVPSSRIASVLRLQDGQIAVLELRPESTRPPVSRVLMFDPDGRRTSRVIPVSTRGAHGQFMTEMEDDRSIRIFDGNFMITESLAGSRAADAVRFSYYPVATPAIGSGGMIYFPYSHTKPDHIMISRIDPVTQEIRKIPIPEVTASFRVKDFKISPGGHLIMLASVDSESGRDGILRGFDPELKQLWKRKINLRDTPRCRPQKVFVLRDGKMITGSVGIGKAGRFASLSFRDERGRELWRKIIKANDREEIRFQSLVELDDGSLLVAGHGALLKKGVTDGFILRLDRSGRFIPPGS